MEKDCDRFSHGSDSQRMLCLLHDCPSVVSANILESDQITYEQYHVTFLTLNDYCSP